MDAALKPLPLWTGILAGPMVWATDLCVSYALVHVTCGTDRIVLLRGISAVSLVAVAAAALLSWRSLQQAGHDEPSDGGSERARARFMAILGLTGNAFFAVTIIALAIPRWVLDAACH